jgi:hypothetical protein
MRAANALCQTGTEGRAGMIAQLAALIVALAGSMPSLTRSRTTVRIRTMVRAAVMQWQTLAKDGRNLMSVISVLLLTFVKLTGRIAMSLP